MGRKDEKSNGASKPAKGADGGANIDKVSKDSIMDATTAGPTPLEPLIDQAIQRHLGRKLKATYDDLVSQPIPDRFRKLLEDLERQEAKPETPE